MIGSRVSKQYIVLESFCKMPILLLCRKKYIICNLSTIRYLLFTIFCCISSVMVFLSGIRDLLNNPHRNQCAGDIHTCIHYFKQLFIFFKQLFSKKTRPKSFIKFRKFLSVIISHRNHVYPRNSLRIIFISFCLDDDDRITLMIF